MQLNDLLKDIAVIPAAADRDVVGLVLDSRKLQPGNVFFALKGTHLDGRKFIPEAIQKGVAAVIVDADSADEVCTMQQQIPIIPIYQLQQKLGPIAARFYDYPAKKMRMIGVTGTNGKTSCTHFIAQMLTALNIPCGIIGTLGSGFYGALGEAGLTTPDAITLQATLHALAERGAQAVAMEVSSHSIDQGRVNGIEFDIGIFTNLTQDHLDYHGTMEAYAGVKHRFIAEFPIKHLVLNENDGYGAQWIHELQAHKSIYAYSAQIPMEYPLTFPQIYADNMDFTLTGMRGSVHTPWGSGELALPLIGQFNLSNALAVLTALCVYGINFTEVLRLFAQLKPVPGRMQTLGGYGKPLAVVDYAHTPDALEKVLQALRAHTAGKLICVFGCGGDRDNSKRPLMAQIAERFADRVIVTSDNPRHEQPEEIAEQIIRGFLHPERVTVELDRSKAIQNSIQYASLQDCILIAGKGAEHYQQIGDQKIPFDDVQHVTAHLEGC